MSKTRSSLFPSTTVAPAPSPRILRSLVMSRSPVCAACWSGALASEHVAARAQGHGVGIGGVVAAAEVRVGVHGDDRLAQRALAVLGAVLVGGCRDVDRPALRRRGAGAKQAQGEHGRPCCGPARHPAAEAHRVRLSRPRSCVNPGAADGPRPLPKTGSSPAASRSARAGLVLDRLAALERVAAATADARVVAGIALEHVVAAAAGGTSVPSPPFSSSSPALAGERVLASLPSTMSSPQRLDDVVELGARQRVVVRRPDDEADFCWQLSGTRAQSGVPSK